MTARPASGSAKKKPRQKSDKTGWFRVFAAIVVPLMHVLARYEIVDGEKLPRQGAYVITPNHYSNIDPLVIAVIVYKLGRAPRFLAKDSLFKVPVLGWVLRKTGQIKVDRQSRGASAAPLREAQQITDQQSVVIVYPEGTLTRDPDLWPMRGKTGAARLAQAADIPIIPIAHWGTQNLMPRYSSKIKLFPRARIRIKIGDPYRLGDIPIAQRGSGNVAKAPQRSSDSAVLKQQTDYIMDRVTELVADLRGEEAPTERWDPAEHGQKETGKF